MNKIPMHDCFALDEFRSYTSCLHNAPYIPVVSPFEDWLEPKPNHKAKHNELYLVKILQKDHPIYNKEIVLMFGQELIKLRHFNKIRHELIGYIQLITLSITDIKTLIAKNDIIQEEDDEYSHLTQSCLAKAIWRTYQESYNKYYSARKDPVLSSKRLTMASLVKTCLDQEYIIGTEVEMTPDQAIKWFAEINLGIEFYSNADNKLLLKYHPEQFNRNIKPSILRIIYHSEHIERIAEMKSFEKKCLNEEVEHKLSDQYYCEKVKSNEQENLQKIQIATSRNDVLDIQKNIYKEISDSESLKL